MNNLPNENCSFLFCTIGVKTGKAYANYRGRFYLYAFVNHHRLFTIVQSIYCIFLIKIMELSKWELKTYQN